MEHSNKKQVDILFILKQRNSQSYGSGLSSGLFNSARILTLGLEKLGINCVIEQVVDNNGIDAVVTKHKPKHVIIEALWVVPDKFNILKRLHPNVKWIIRIHSEVPFLAGEGIAMDWIGLYKHMGITIACNSVRAQRDLEHAFGFKPILLPNYYDLEESKSTCKTKDKEVINIGCFGAIRPLKNQLIQASAALAFARKHNIGLKFHINSSRVESSGENILKNLRNLFKHAGDKYELVECGWLDHKDFLEVISKMDLSMQVSFSETFNIVTADAVSQYVPVVVSHEINWIPSIYRASSTDLHDIVSKMERALVFGWIGTKQNIRSLKKYNKETLKTWFKSLG